MQSETTFFLIMAIAWAVCSLLPRWRARDNFIRSMCKALALAHLVVGVALVLWART